MIFQVPQRVYITGFRISAQAGSNLTALHCLLLSELFGWFLTKKLRLLRVKKQPLSLPSRVKNSVSKNVSAAARNVQ